MQIQFRRENVLAGFGLLNQMDGLHQSIERAFNFSNGFMRLFRAVQRKRDAANISLHNLLDGLFFNQRAVRQ